jgi:hypothetical protein
MENKVLTISPNLVINDHNGSHTRDELARAVAYWEDKITSVNDPRPIAICFGAGSTTFQTIALLLAIISSGRNYYKFDQLSPGAIKEDIKYPKIEGGVSITFIAGSVKTDFDYSNDPDVVEIELEKFLLAAKTYESLHILTFEFKQSQKRYNNTSGTTTGFPKLIEATVGNDGHSIKTAMDNYILEDDHCGFSHSMSHIGVHTTAILPSIFKAKKVSFIETGFEWQEKVADVTHTQFFYTMVDLYNFPDQHNVKTVTTGGDFLMPNLVNKLLSAGVEKIVDIYGLTEAAPPLAIREITCLDDMNKPFKWVNDAYDCYIDERGTAVVIRPDGVHWKANDLARYDRDTKEFYYLGRYGAGLRVRIQGLLFDTHDFKEKFESETMISNYFLDTTSNIPKLLITAKDQLTAEKFINDFEVAVELHITDHFRTNGGIKNTA